MGATLLAQLGGMPIRWGTTPTELLTWIDFEWRLDDRPGKEALATQITARPPDGFVATLDGAASQLRRTRADVVRQAIEYYLDDLEGVAAAIRALQDPADHWRWTRPWAPFSRASSTA